MSQQRKRLLLAAATGLLAFWAIGLLALANRDEPSALVTAEGDRTPFRGGTLPAGILGAPAPR